MAKDVDKANSIGMMDHFMKAIGPITWQTEKEDLYMRMEMFMRANGKMIKLMAMDFMITLMELDIRVVGLKINNMEWE